MSSLASIRTWVAIAALALPPFAATVPSLAGDGPTASPPQISVNSAPRLKRGWANAFASPFFAPENASYGNKIAGRSMAPDAYVAESAGSKRRWANAYVSPFFLAVNDVYGTKAGGPAVANTTTYALDNFDATVEPGEPSDGGLFSTTRNARVVIHTFESEFDTDLAVYTGTQIANLALVARNDNFLASGISTTQSLVQFDATAGTKYHVQIGSKFGAEDNVFTTISVLPPGGGLSAWLATVFGNPFQGRDFVCIAPGSCNPTLLKPKFVLYNSTASPMQVTSSSDLGPAVTPPAPVNIPSKGIAVVQYNFNGFNSTTVRTVAGHFTFAGRVGATVVATDQVRALFVVKPSTPPDVLTTTVSDPLRAAGLNQPRGFRVTVQNTGLNPAIGCHARSDSLGGTRLKTIWQRVDPTTGNNIGGLDAPATIPAGGSIALNVTTASQEWREGDPTTVTGLIIDCANTATRTDNIRGSFDLTAQGTFMPADATTRVISTTDVLAVPAPPATASFAWSINTGPTATLTARGTYSGWWSDPAGTNYTATICQLTAANGTCMQAAASEVNYAATHNAAKYFKVFVRAPATNPGFDPTKRRVFLRFMQQLPPPNASGSVLVGAASIAVRKN